MNRIEKPAAPRPAPNTARGRDVAYHLHPYTNPTVLAADGPFIVARGEGVRVFDEAGRGYIEAMAGLGNVSLGFSEPRLTEAAARQLDTLPFYHAFGGKTAEPAIDLAERLVGLAPAPMSKVFFTSSGSEANDTAMKLVWYLNNALGRPEKKKIIARENAYHGVTVGSGSLTGLARNHRAFDLPIAGVLHTDCPHYYANAEDGESEADYAARLASNLEALIQREGPETIAAFFAEPIIGAGGVMFPPKGYFEKIVPILRKHDILFVVDEIFVGFGRTGRMFASEHYGLAPDIMIVGKAMTSAYFPMSAVLISEPVFEAVAAQSDALGVFGHGLTYGGHPVGCAVALETLAIYEERDILGHVAEMAGPFRRGLESLADHPLVGDVRTMGLLGAVELVRDKKTRTPFPEADHVPMRTARLAQDHGVITRGTGNSLTFSPPLVIAEAEIAEMVAGVGAALDAMQEQH